MESQKPPIRQSTVSFNMRRSPIPCYSSAPLFRAYREFKAEKDFSLT